MPRHTPKQKAMQAMIAIFMITMFPACQDAECSSGDDHCDGSVAWACNGGGDKGALKWETRTCEEGTTCKGGVCFSPPLVACLPEQEGQWGCNPARTYPGQCTAACYWAWDLGQYCEPPDTRCELGWIDDNGTQVSAAMCVMPLSTCPPQSSTRVCHNDIVTACTPLGFQGKVQDCAAEGKVCRNGACI